MAPKPVQIDRFPGLDLRQDPSEWPGALDCQNVEFQAGRVKTRPGTSAFWATNGSFFLFGQDNEVASPFLLMIEPAIPATTIMLQKVGAGIGSPASSTTFTSGTALIASAVSVGTPTATYTYVCCAGVIKRLDGVTAAWTTPAGMPATPRVLTVSPVDNRLVVCSSAADSKVSFSDAGAPETFGANNYVQLRPGDGELIHGAAVFNNQTFIFKGTKFFVFYGTSVDSTGDPVFNYRVVEGMGMASLQPQSVTVGPDGVYFIGRDGIYRTTGGAPQRISDPIRPYFTTELAGDDEPSFWDGGWWNPASMKQCLTWFDGRLYAILGQITSAGATTGSVMFVFDPALNTWSRWAVANLYTAATMRINGKPTLFLGLGTGIAQLDATATSDAFTPFAITSYYRSGFMEMGSPGLKTIRDTIIEGNGTLSFAWSADNGILGSTTTVTLRTIRTAPSSTRIPRAVQGRRFSYNISGFATLWSVNYLQPNTVADRAPYVTLPATYS